MTDRKFTNLFPPFVQLDYDNSPRMPRDVRDLEREIELLRRKTTEQDAVLDQIQQQPIQYATVLRFHTQSGKKWATCAFSGSIADIQVTQMLDGKLRIGSRVRIAPQAGGVVDILETQFDVGDVVTVKRVVDELRVEIELPGGMSRVVYCDSSSFPGLKAGNKIVLDQSATTVVSDLGRDAESEKYVLQEETNVSWDDVAGLAEPKKLMIEAIELPARHPELYKAYGKKPLKGVMLEGPPGCGKTLLAKAAATALAAVYGAKGGFIYVKGPEILTRWVGESERQIRQIFERARDHKRTHGHPAVIFIDEADAILGRRGSGVSADMERTIVPQFLSELDGLGDSGAMLLLATNKPGSLDPAVVRDGRIDRKITVPRPTEKEAIDYFKIHLRGKPIDTVDESDALAEFAAAELYSERHVVRTVQLIENEALHLHLAHLASGAMIWGVVDLATSIALERDLKKKKNQSFASGIRRDDIREAIAKKLVENRNVNHDDTLVEIAKQTREKRAIIRAGEG